MGNKNLKESHTFAFYWPQTSKLRAAVGSSSECIIQDGDLCHRMIHVLRLHKSQEIIIFDAHAHMHCVIESLDARQVRCSVISSLCNRVPVPEITFMLPLLKKEALEESIYTLTELGANRIELVMVQKVQKIWGGAKEMDRLERIMYAAAEQSKNFALPVIIPPVSLQEAVGCTYRGAIKVFFDAQGCSATSLIASINTSIATRIVLMVGPEGDLATHEKSFLQDQGFLFCRLTPTIMRAHQAVAVSLGMLRSALLFSDNERS